jgi:aryl-alcohol dehydrogenase-like predicted oxidoreductase
VRAGKVRNIGMSNVPAWFVGEAVAIARLRGWEPIAALQVQYSLLTRTVEGEQFGAARAFGLGMVPWSPLANGTLSGKYSRANKRSRLQSGQICEARRGHERHCGLRRYGVVVPSTRFG